MGENSVQNKITGAYYVLTAAERKVADYVLSHLSATQFMSISELAAECGVAEATVSRFCRRLDYRGYSAFKLEVAKSAAQSQSGQEEEPELPETPDGIQELAGRLTQSYSRALAQTTALLRPQSVIRAADILSRASHVYCMGQGGSMILAMEASHLFSTCLPHYYAIQGSHIQAITAALLGPEDALLYFSYSGSTKDCVDLLLQARNAGAKVVLITRFPKSPAAAYADVVLQCGSDESPLQLGSIPARMAQLFLVDLLFREVCRRDSAAVARNRECTAGALAEKHL